MTISLSSRFARILKLKHFLLHQRSWWLLLAQATQQKTGDFLHCGKSPVFVILGHADTEMTEHSLHVQESIRQSAIQLFSEAFSA